MAASGTRIEGVTVNLGDGDADRTPQHRLRTVVVANNTDLDNNDKIDGGGNSAAAASSARSTDRVPGQHLDHRRQFRPGDEHAGGGAASRPQYHAGANATRPASTRRCEPGRDGAFVDASAMKNASPSSDPARPTLSSGSDGDDPFTAAAGATSSTAAGFRHFRLSDRGGTR